MIELTVKRPNGEIEKVVVSGSMDASRFAAIKHSTLCAGRGECLAWSVDGVEFSIPGRVKIIAGSKQVGDAINGHTITGLGTIWTQVVDDHETSAWGLAPGKNHKISVQYAYYK
jgi:hypothetical protein